MRQILRATRHTRRALCETILFAVIIVTTASACGGVASGAATAATTPTDTTPLIIATTGIWADIVRNVACDGAAEVTMLIPDGGDPHAFEPSLADRARLERSSLVVANGLNLEAGLRDTLEAVEQAGTPVFRIGNFIDTIAVSIPTNRAGSFRSTSPATNRTSPTSNRTSPAASPASNRTNPASNRTTDPHIWFDPYRVSNALPSLVQHLIDHTDLSEAVVNTCLVQYRSELAVLDARLADIFAAIPAERRLLVTSHDSLGYLADRYGLEVVGTVSPAASTIAATNPSQLTQLVKLIAADGVPAIFTETQRSTDDAEALASRAGIVQLVSLFTENLGPPGSGADTYTGLLATDAQRIAGALTQTSQN